MAGLVMRWVVIAACLAGRVAAAVDLPEPKRICTSDGVPCERTLVWGLSDWPSASMTIGEAMYACALRGSNLPSDEQVRSLGGVSGTFRAWLAPSTARPSSVFEVQDGIVSGIKKSDPAAKEPVLCVRELWSAPASASRIEKGAPPADPLFGLSDEYAAPFRALPASAPKIGANEASCRFDSVDATWSCLTSFPVATARGPVQFLLSCRVSKVDFYPPLQSCSIHVAREGRPHLLLIADEVAVQSSPDSPAERFEATRIATEKSPLETVLVDVPITTLGAAIAHAHMLFRVGLVDISLAAAERTRVAWVLAQTRENMLKALAAKSR